MTASSSPRRLGVLCSTPSITTMMTSSIARRFWVAVTDRLQGISLQASHPH
jgi:hypothetical protein